ncbi:MAG: hypothetical protein Q9191_004158 [Dirinaria sp. TL-2023a]
MPSGLPSPTLTNPDMILPFDSPSPASASRRAQRNPSPPPFDEIGNFHSAEEHGADEMKSAVRKLLPNGDGARLRKPRQENGTLEKAKRSRNSRSPPDHAANGFHVLASSPIINSDDARPIETLATLNGNDRSHWNKPYNMADRDASSPHSEDSQDGVDLSRPTYSFPSLDNEKDGFSAPPEVEDEDSYSHAAMSIRAEQILANAKKRLTNMEGNLNRARGTLQSRPSSSMSYTNQSHEAVSMYSLPPMRSAPLRHRQTNTPPTVGGQKGHARVFSETSVPSTLNTPAQRDIAESQAPRSLSALGSSSAEAAGGNSPEKARNWFWTGLARNTSHAQKHTYLLEAVDEDGPAPASFETSSPPSGDVILEEDEEQEEEQEAEKATGGDDRARNTAAFESQVQPAHGLTRARSTNQMRDLRDQMQDLKGKISSLKERARKDSLRRRSLQSLRTPSPFTAAEQWYAGTPPLQSQPATSQNSHIESGGEATGSSRDEARGEHASRGLESGVLQQAGTESDESSFDLTPSNDTEMPAPQPDIEGAGEQSASDRNGAQPPSVTEDDGHHQHEMEIQDPGADIEADSLYGDHDYHEASLSPIGERHEDRPDAFDYEHFFLHSGTGTLARKGSNRSSSNSSTFSVETTKPSNVNNRLDMMEDEDADSATHGSLKRRTSSKQKAHSRNNSITSVSTVATFATATEGKGGFELDEGEEAASEDDEWVLHHPIAGSWQPDRSTTTTKRKIAAANNNNNNNEPSQNGAAGGGKRHATATRIMPSTQSNPVPAVPSPYRAEQRPPPHDSTKSGDLLAVLEAALPPHDDGDNGDGRLQLSEGDRDLVDRLIKSLAIVCAEIRRKGAAGSKYEERLCRRRLDAARRVLDGEMNGEPF